MTPLFDWKFAGRLWQLRNRAGLSQRELARRAGIDVSQISRFESAERRPRLDDLAKLAQAFGLTVSGLLRGV